MGSGEIGKTSRDPSDASKWLRDEDSQCFEDRLSRLNWLVDESPRGQYWTFPGGLLAKSLFEETRYCFVCGQFLAATVLGLAYIEQTLSALFYGSGRNDLERKSLATLLEQAHTNGLITYAELQDLERVRRKRNPYVHFRKPGHRESIESRSIEENEAPYGIIERDAAGVITAALKIVAKNSV